MPNSYPTSADQKACSPHSPHPNGPALAIDREQQQSREAARGKKTACDPRRYVIYTPERLLIWREKRSQIKLMGRWKYEPYTWSSKTSR